MTTTFHDEIQRMRKLYPDRTVRAALIWTETPEIMEIPGPRLDAATPVHDIP